MSNVRTIFASTLYANAVNIGGQLILVPFFLRALGSREYGYWLVIYSIPACFAFLDAGVGNSLGNDLSIAYHRNDFRQAQRMLSAVWKYQIISLSTCIFAFTLAVLYLPLRSAIGLANFSNNSFAVLSSVLAIYTALSVQAGVFTAIFRAAGQFDRIVRLNAHGRVAEVTATVVVLETGGGLVQVGCVLLIAKTVTFLILWKSSSQLLPEVKLDWSGGSWFDFARLVKMGVAFTAWPLSGGIVNQGSTILLNHTVGPIGVVALSVARQVARLYWNIINALVTGLQVELTKAYAVREFERQRMLFAAGLCAVIWTAIPAVTMMTIVGPKFISLWTRGSVVVGGVFLMVCGIEVVVVLLGQCAGLPAFASNRHIGISAVYIGTTIAGFVPAVILIRTGRIEFIPISFAATGVIFILYAYRKSSALIAPKKGYLWKVLLAPGELVRIVVRYKVAGPSDF